MKHVIEDVNKAIELAPENASYYSNRANYKKLIYNDLEGAAKDMGMAIELDHKLMIVPYSNIQYVEIDPAPSGLPITIIQGAKHLTS